MGSFDCYCAICAGPLGTDLIFGSRGQKPLAKRRQRINKRRRKLAGEDVESSDESEGEDPEKDMEDADVKIDIEESDGEEEFDEGQEEYSYDPELVAEAETAWTNMCRCIGFNSDAPGLTKAYISGRGHYSDYGGFDVREPSNDPNDIDDGYYSCYMSSDVDDRAVFPFHELCYELLARYITGQPKPAKINKDIMYSTLSQLYKQEWGGVLSYVNYGHVNGGEQFWTCVSGEEWTICDFSTKEKLGNPLRQMIEVKGFNASATTIDLAEKVRSDPLTKLPYDILYLIFPYLDRKSTFNLMEASWQVFSSTRNDVFWKQLIRLEFLSWFWELGPILNDGLPADINYKSLFFWLDKVTEGTYGMEGPLISIANRKRIWRVCGQIAEVYRMKMFKELTQHADEEDDNKEAEAILEKSSSSYLEIVSLPLIHGGQHFSKQIIRSWDEIDNQSCVFETCWNEAGALVGLGVIFGKSRRIFGEIPDEQNRYTTSSAHIPPGEWIREIVLGITNIDVFGGSKKTRAFVASIALKLTSGGKRYLDGPREDAVLMRGLVVPPNLHLTGIVGSISSDGVISRLGILQTSHPSNADLETPATSPAQNLLWGPGSTHLQHAPMWNHPRINVLPFWSREVTDIPNDMLPHHTLHWAHDESQLRSLKRLCAYVIVGGTVSTTDHHGKWITRSVHDILAFRAEYHEPENSEAKRLVNTLIGYPPKQRGEDGSITGNQSFQEENWMQFDIDGPGGERVTEVQVAQHSKAVRLKTNRGRMCFWGEQDRDRWHTLRAPEDEVIVGLVASFGKPSGYDHKTSTYSHLKTSAITALTMNLVSS
ncbi:hypothetical protein BDV96DRAFT_642695 [Lophiotrema nucula]|uniref:F-box domain-containing protein n=1 Tax=Lophiotrema nucula TaxID=690887 RepID=A0A6A5ZJD3_9PLEO|nr:hypothetical protein BDV96DRAFT_642695 [Lophiotrema nucula]